MNRRRYKNPPIDEALCEFRFAPSREWNLTVPGRLQTELGDQYSAEVREQKVTEVELTMQRDQPPGLQHREGLAKVQLVDTTGTRMVGVGADALSIHMLRPYQSQDTDGEVGWDEFKPRISKALNAYWRVAEPEGVNRIGIRYINKIVIPHGGVAIDDYLMWALPKAPALPQIVRHFVNRIEYVYPDGALLIVNLGSLPSSSDNAQFLLDIDVIREKSEPMDQDQALELVEDLRSREREAFESLIKDKARELFNVA